MGFSLVHNNAFLNLWLLAMERNPHQTLNPGPSVQWELSYASNPLSFVPSI